MLKKLKKIFLYAILIIVVAKCFQIVFFNKAMPTSGEDEKGIAVYKKFNYGDYTTIKLLHTETGEVEELPLDIYLYGVVSAEMPASFEDEALKIGS